VVENVPLNSLGTGSGFLLGQ